MAKSSFATSVGSYPACMTITNPHTMGASCYVATMHPRMNFHADSSAVSHTWQLIRGGCQPDSLDAESQAPLHKAVLCNQPDAIQALMLNGANLNIRDSTGSTALHVSVHTHAVYTRMYTP